MMMMDEETKRPSGASERGAAGLGEDDLSLRRDYDDAVECLAKCDCIIQDLMGQLKSKDERISNMEDRIVRMSLELANSKAYDPRLESKDERIACLEGKVAEMEAKIVRMSLELASSKAFEDQHRSTRRVSETLDCEDDGLPRLAASMDVSASAEAPASMRRSLGLGGISPRSSMGMRSSELNVSHRRSWWSAGSVSTAPDDDDLDASIAGSRDASDESSSYSSGKLSASIGQFLFRNRHQRRLQENKEEEDAMAIDDGGEKKEGDGRADYGRRRPSRRRPGRGNIEPPLQLQSSLNSLRGVVFPSSFESVVVRGCLELGSSFRNSLRDSLKDGLGDSLKDSLGGTLGTDLHRELRGSENSHREVPRAA